MSISFDLFTFRTKFKVYILKYLEFFDLEVEFLEEIQFNRLWEKNISNKTRESIWKYLQTFQLISINLKSSEALNKALEGDKIDKSEMKDLKKMQKLSEEVQSKNNNTEGENELDQMLGGLMDSGIGEIAKEVAQGLDVESMFGNVDENSNPMELMAQMMNPEKMGSIFNNINSVRITDPGFDYHSDKTLRPEARLSPNVTLINSDSITNIVISDGGANYTDAPDLVITRFTLE